MEELSLFDFTPIEVSKENKIKIEKENKSNSKLLEQRELFLEFPLTMPSQSIKDKIIEMYMNEGLKKRAINKILKGLFFKEKIFNTKLQATQYLKEIDHTYAVKYKIGIEPSPKLVAISEKLKKKEELLKRYAKEIEEKFKVAFITCANCKSRLNTKFIKNYTCALCSNDLRNSRQLQRLQKTQETVQNLKDKLEFETRKYNSHFTGGEKWILRIVNNIENSNNEK